MTFNGTVVVLWNNVSGGESFMPGDRVARLLLDGFAIMGVAAQVVGVEGRDGMPALKTGDPDRYRDLHHPGDDYCYDIYTQAGQLLAPDRPRESDPLAGLDVQHLVAMGVSQSAARLAAYLNGVQSLTSRDDAFLIVVFPNSPCALNVASAPAEVREAGPGNLPGLLPWHEHLLRDDLGVPVIVLNSEWESGSATRITRRTPSSCGGGR